MVNKVLHIHVK